MENASKALIIAGAILLSILIITLGIAVFTQAQDVTKSAGLSKTEIQSFNSQFQKYEVKQKGSSVKALVSEVIASNASDKADDNGRSITITVDGKAPGANGYVVSSSAQYNVTYTTDDNTGYINTITVTKATKSTN